MIMNSTMGQELVPDLGIFTLGNFHVFDPIDGLASPGARCWLAVAVMAFLMLMVLLSTAYAYMASRSQDSNC